MKPPRRRCRPLSRSGSLREDRGAATGWAILLVIVVGLLAGTVLDGGNAMANRVQILDIAQQAARAGANQLDLTALRGPGVVRLDPVAAEAAATAFLDQVGATGTATATPTEVTVTVTDSRPTLVLQAIGVNAIPVKATARAVPVTGAQVGG